MAEMVPARVRVTTVSVGYNLILGMFGGYNSNGLRLFNEPHSYGFISGFIPYGSSSDFYFGYCHDEGNGS